MCKRISALVALGLWLALLASGPCAAQSNEEAKSKTSRAQLTPERAITAARRMRDQLNDPDSLRVVSFLTYESAAEAHDYCVIFRAKEQGSLVLQRFANNAANTSPGIFNPPELVWGVMCKGEMVYDATDVVKAALKADRAKAKEDDE